ncbi:MAG: YdcH family protein [Magnetococcales bacterium]|nr:YdcH family protein [Magnetococcales bacterium]
MFEDQLAAMQELLSSNDEFRELHEKHQSLEAEIEALGPAGVADMSVERLKKEKLLIKDKLAAMMQLHTADAAAV